MTKTVVNFILDRSGSMDMVRDATISGFNEYLGELQKKGGMLFSLTTFDSEGIDLVTDQEDVKKVKKLNKDTFVPRGMTPLYDAVCRTLSIAENDSRKIKQLVVIMTDGEENSSQEYTEKHLNDMITRLKKDGNWTFVFLGANQDAYANAQKYGISMGNTMSFQSTAKSVGKTFRAVATANVAYMNSHDVSTTRFFNNDEDKDEVKKQK